ncbi:MAG: AMP-binding protein [Gemmatimonadaceae bacterium]|nr:AMP-binding protein [Gemmatimonadaceae bacterium]
MSEPFSVVSLAIAGGRGRISSLAPAAAPLEAQQLIAAGLTLLQRSAPLVRALSGYRSAILLPASPSWFVALAASEGRGALLLDPSSTIEEVDARCAAARVGALFTIASMAAMAPPGVAIVLLDDAPNHARVLAGHREQQVDLGSHHGLSLEAAHDVPGRNEEAMLAHDVTGSRESPTSWSHAALLAEARAAARVACYETGDVVLSLLPFSRPRSFCCGVLAPLLAGAHVVASADSPMTSQRIVLADQATVVYGSASHYERLLREMHRRASPLPPRALRRCLCEGPAVPRDLAERWALQTNLSLEPIG